MIYAVYGQINSGKDTFAEFANSYFKENGVEKYEIKKFADELKNTLCRWLGCTREQIEDREFKEKELGPEWWYHIKVISCEKNIMKEVKIPYVEGENKELKIYKHTVRTLLQLLGTDCGRNILHPSIWVNCLMNQYLPMTSYRMDIFNFSEGNITKISEGEDIIYTGFPNWIITDLRFDNEMDAVKNKDGITIKILRKFGLKFPEYSHLENSKDPYGIPGRLRIEDFELWKKLTHESEIGLLNRDDFDYIIYNNGTLEDYQKEVIKIISEQ